MYIFMPVAKCISSARRRHHMSYNDVANGICPRQMLIEFEKGISLPSKETAIKLANRLGYVPETFILALRDDVEIRSNGRMLREQNSRFFTIMQGRDAFAKSKTSCIGDS